MEARPVCYSQRGVSGRRGKEMAWKVNRSWAFVCCIGISLLQFPSAYALRHKGQSSAGTFSATRLPDSDAKGQTFVCLANPEGQDRQTSGSAANFAATLSETEPKVSLQCGQGTTVVPGKLAEGFVCPADLAEKDLTKCKDPKETPTADTLAPRADVLSDEKQVVSLAGLMGGDPTTSAIKWDEENAATDGSATGGKTYTLRLPESPLPLLDSTFLAGCLKNTANHCVLTVTVEARKSAASGQTVHCAYGAKSNPDDRRPTVTITREKNTLTLVCGTKDATTIPADMSEYCTDNSAACKTKQKYTALIPGFHHDWWKQTGPGTWTLTVPKDQVPSSAQTIHLGCQYTAKKEEKTSGPDKGPTACMVDVALGTPGESSAAGAFGTMMLGGTLALTALNVSFA